MNMAPNLIQSHLLQGIAGIRHGFTNKQMPKGERLALDEKVCTAKQVHGDSLIWVSQWEKQLREADAIATLSPGTPVGVYSADCTPLLFAAVGQYTKQPIAVMAVHAGWRGTAQKIAAKSLSSFAQRISETGNSATRIFAVIGPCVSFESFEVGEEVLREFPGAEERGLARFLREEEGRRKYLMDLPGENLRQLKESALPLGMDLETDQLGHCTVKETEKFPSHRRRDRESMGGILSFIYMEI